MTTTNEKLQNIMQTLTSSELETLKKMIDKKIENDANKQHAADIMILNNAFTITNFDQDTNYDGIDIEKYNSIQYCIEMTVNEKIRMRLYYELLRHWSYEFYGITIELIVKKKYRDKNNKIKKKEKKYDIEYEFVDGRKDYNDKLCLNFSTNALNILNELKIRETDSNKILLGILLNNLIWKMYDLYDEHKLSNFKQLYIKDDIIMSNTRNGGEKQCDITFVFDKNNKNNQTISSDAMRDGDGE